MFLELRSPGVPGYGLLYHFGHAPLHARHGSRMKPFPWVAYSAMNRFSGDIRYGSHMFLVPVTFLRDEVTRALSKIAARN